MTGGCASPSGGVSTGSGLLVTSCADPRGRRRDSGRPDMRNPARRLCIRAGPECFSMPPCGVRAPPAGPGTCHPATVFPADLLSRCERSDPIALSRENLMTWYCGPGYSPVASPPSATPPARPEIAHPSAEARTHVRPFWAAGVPACTDGRQYAVLHKIGTGICHPMTSGPDLCEWAAQGLVLRCR